MEKKKSQLIKYKIVNYLEKEGVDKNEEEVVEEVEEEVEKEDEGVGQEADTVYQDEKQQRI